MANVIIFGIQDTAQLAHYYLENDSEHTVIAFCVHEKYLPDTPIFCSLPVIAFENIGEHYPPNKYHFFAPMTGSGMNQVRKDVYSQIKYSGYSFISYISSHATNLCESIGENCFILEDNTLQPFTRIGNNVVLWSGNHIGHHSHIGDHVCITSHVVVSGHCRIGPQSFIGVNTTLRDGLTLAEGTFVAQACSLTTSTTAWSAWKGNPAKQLKQLSTDINIYHEMV